MKDLNTLKDIQNLQQHEPEDADYSDNKYKSLK